MTINIKRFENALLDHWYEFVADAHTGVKRHHWMWFIFPQIKGLGRSFIAQHYAIEDLGEAKAFWAYEYCREHYLCATELIVSLGDSDDIRRLLGDTDFMKLKSSLTLFAQASDNHRRIQNTLNMVFAGELCPFTSTACSAWQFEHRG